MADDTPKHHERLAHDARREAILRAAREVIARDGLSRMSVAAIAKQAGCTRSLFYHYFPTKEDVLQAVLDENIEAFIDRLRAWNAGRTPGDIEGALDSIAHVLKAMILDQSDELARSLATSGGAALYASFVHRVSSRTARYICSSTVVDFAARHEVRIDHLYETFYILISGLVMFVRTHPEVPEETLKDIIASTLHIEGYTSKYPERRPER